MCMIIMPSMFPCGKSNQPSFALLYHLYVDSASFLELFTGYWKLLGPGREFFWSESVCLGGTALTAGVYTLCTYVIGRFPDRWHVGLVKGRQFTLSPIVFDR